MKYEILLSFEAKFVNSEISQAKMNVVVVVVRGEQTFAFFVVGEMSFNVLIFIKTHHHHSSSK